MQVETGLAIVAVICAIVCARWAMELGFSQFRQLLWGIFGLVAGPLAMLCLYVRLLRTAPDRAKRWF
jgi:hypothetical protein